MIVYVFAYFMSCRKTIDSIDDMPHMSWISELHEVKQDIEAPRSAFVEAEGIATLLGLSRKNQITIGWYSTNENEEIKKVH